MSSFLSRTGRKILDHNLASLIRMDSSTPSILDELVLDFHEYPQLVIDQIVNHRYFNDFFYGILKIMDVHTPKFPGVAGNAAYILGALLDSELGRKKVIDLLRDEDKYEETQHCLPNLAALIETYDLEAMTNASGTASLMFECEESRMWGLGQPSCEWLIFILSRSLLETDMWVASNCALTLARMCMCDEGKKLVQNHKESEAIIINLILSTGVDNEGRGMNAAFAIAYLCEDEECMKRVAYMKESLDLNMGLINMLRSVDEGCRKNALFCLKTISSHKDGKDRLNDDPDIEHLLKLLCNSLTCGEEDLGKMAAVTLSNLAETKEGYMLQKDHSTAKTSLQHVLTNMNISEDYRAASFEAMKNCMLPKPEPPMLKVLDAYTIEANWKPIEPMSGNDVQYELYCGDKIIYTGPELTFTTSGLKERTDYEFRLRAFTEDEEESFVSDGSVIQTFRAISSPPRNLRIVSCTSSQVKIVWEKPAKVCGNLKGYYVQEQGSAMHYEPVYLYHIASNLEADKEYIFEVCAVTQRGRGEMAEVNVRTLRTDYYAPSKPTLICVGAHEIVCTWKAPIAPAGRINGYEVMCNGKSIYFGMNKRCLATMLRPSTKYKFTVVAWTNEGRTESDVTIKKTTSSYKKKPKRKPWKTKDDLMKWLDSKEEVNEEELEELGSDDDTTEGDNSSHTADDDTQQDEAEDENEDSNEADEDDDGNEEQDEQEEEDGGGVASDNEDEQQQTDEVEQNQEEEQAEEDEREVMEQKPKIVLKKQKSRGAKR